MVILAVLVDDDEGLCECLIPVLKDLTNVQVIDVAQTPTDAISLIAKYELDWELLILDIDLRNGSGLDVMTSCQKRLPHQHVFVLTNMSTPFIRGRCHDLGVDAVFDKTTELDKFFDHCKNFKTLSYEFKKYRQ
jgi:DNA-binding NarL/FixJ family response regulator